ncbi:MAG TPA: DUF177 domain-containing protein [Acidimicrobiales bacterium]|nr:DUF177 domain-containing protein [Acidimicrobiales bacterium]
MAPAKAAASGGLRVNVADLTRKPGARRHERVSGRFGAMKVVGTSVPAGTEVVVDAVLEWVSDGVLASGEAIAPWEGECRRCLGPVRGEARAEFRELFERRAREGETYPLRNEHIDLEPLAREALLIELPLAPLCSLDCRGLCPTCGADLNTGACDCPEPQGDPRWQALDVLKGALDKGPGGGD